MAGGAALAALNAWIVWHAFFLEFAGKTNSMQGFWIAIARLADGWWAPSWWPYWFGGMPFEFTYAPMVPWLAAVLGGAGLPLGRALHCVLAIAYCAGPVALFFMARQLSGRAGWSFVAAALYALWSPAELLLPDGAFAWSHVSGARRLYVTFVWDEAPHQLALALVCVAVTMLARGSRVAAAFAMAAAALANTFGVTSMALFAVCLAASRGGWIPTALTGAAAWVLASPWLPPSLIVALRGNAQLFDESAFTARSWLALAIVLGGAALVHAMSRNRAGPALRFALLLAWVCTAIPVLYYRADLHFIPQAGRYKIEMELALTLLVVFAAAPWVDRLPGLARVVLALIAVGGAAHQAVEHRRYARAELREADPSATIEARVARWLDGNLPGQVVMAPGSIAQWMNAYGGAIQFNGGSYPTAPNAAQQRVLFAQFGSPVDEAVNALAEWGVDAVVVPGKSSPEFWKPYGDPAAYGKLRLLWREDDTSIFEIPRPGGVRVAWHGHNRAVVTGSWKAGEAVTIPVNFHAGWTAPVPIERGSNAMIVAPSAPAGVIELVFRGSWEQWLCRAASLAMALTLAAARISGRVR